MLNIFEEFEAFLKVLHKFLFGGLLIGLCIPREMLCEYSGVRLSLITLEDDLSE